ncbi:PPE family protein [Mycobacterium angelicum]|nr:PPE family protein [Mycobacterium angelicum]MCV7197218.1 PPE family protein [Mycobacterium angelicum]
MNFQLLPPEVTSMQMFGGLGSRPLLTAASGWNNLAGELDSAAASFEAVTSELVTGAWQGSAATAMTAAAAPYVAWLTAASRKAGVAAGLAQAAAGAFEAAQAATVYPAAVAANRSQLVSLVMSNLFGFNAPAIAAAEAEYESMWAQDIAAMVGYHGEVSMIASALTPFGQLSANLAKVSAAAAPATSGLLPGLVVGLPQVTIPPINIPRFQLPAFDLLGLNIGGFSLPALNIPQISTGGFHLPATSISITANSLTIPSFTFPGFSLPGVAIGGFSTPQLATSPLVLPSLSIPASGFWIPSGGSNIPGNPGQLTSHSPSLNYISLVVGGIPKVLFDAPLIGNVDLKLPSTIYVNFALEVLGPTATPGIYIGDFNLGTGQFTGNTGFVLPPIEVSGFSIPNISVPAWQTPEITLTNPGVTIDIGSIGISGLTFGPLTVPPIAIGEFQVPQVAVGGIDIGAFTTPGPITGTGSLDINLFNLLPKIHIDWTNPLAGIIHPGPNGPFLGPLETPEITASIELPQITVPPIAIPPFNLSAVAVPPIGVSPFSLGQISVPSIQVNGINIGAIDIPNITITPQLPNISVGAFTTPTVSVGSANGFSLPTIKFPKITLPEISLYNPSNPVNTFGLDLNTYAFVDLSGSRITIVPNPFNTTVHLGVPATQIPPLTLVNPSNMLDPVSFVINGTVQALNLPPITIDSFNLALNSGPVLALSDILTSNIQLGAFNTPAITVPPIAVGPLTGFQLPRIGLSGIQFGGFSTPGNIVIPPITVTQTLLPSFTLLPAIPL